MLAVICPYFRMYNEELFNDKSSDFVQWAIVLSSTNADNLALAVAHCALMISLMCPSISGILSAVMVGIKLWIVSKGCVSEF